MIIFLAVVARFCHFQKFYANVDNNANLNADAYACRSADAYASNRVPMLTCANVYYGFVHSAANN